MQLVHRSGQRGDRTEEVLATDVDVADSTVKRARGLLFRRSIPDDYALLFEFDRARPRGLHMLFVPFAIDAVWLRDGEVTHTKRLRPVVGFGRGVADRIVELPAGAAAGVEEGDEIELVDA